MHARTRPRMHVRAGFPPAARLRSRSQHAADAAAAAAAALSDLNPKTSNKDSRINHATIDALASGLCLRVPLNFNINTEWWSL